MINILVNGANGKMGKLVAEEVKKRDNMKVICGIDRQNTENADFPIYSIDNISNLEIIPNLIIDFSVPEATFNILPFALEKKIPIIIATTGFSSEQNEEITEYSKVIPIFKSATMSYEITLLKKIVSDLALKLSDSDIEIVETHHNRKIDAPSGTALLIADSINSALDNEMNYEFNRHSKKEKRSKKEIGIHSIRGGNECGKHSVIFFGKNESLEITHNVNSRTMFAEGALKAAEFIVNQNHGLYNMDDLVK